MHILRRAFVLLLLFLLIDAPLGEAKEPSLQSSDLQYIGSFRLPRGEHGDKEGFSYGGDPIAYNPANNSLFVGNKGSKVSEVSIPEPVYGTKPEDLPFSTVLQEFSDPLEGGLAELDNVSPASIQGLMVYNNKLYGTAAIYYDAANNQTKSHYVRSLNLKEKSATPLYELKHSAGKAGLLSGWIAEIPPEWRKALGGSAISGQCCIPIVSRTSWGPAAFAWNPEDLREGAPAVPLLYYTGNHATLGSWSGSNPTYGGTTQMGGAVIIGNTLLFLGSNGTGPFCYGVGVGNESETGADKCYDPSNSSKGQHAYPYNYQMWAYDLEDLARVKQGEKNPWEVTPYGVWPLSLPTLDPYFILGGVAYDPSTQRLFVSQMRADTDGYSARALIHVFRANVPGNSAPAVSAPTSLSAAINLSTNDSGFRVSKNLGYGLMRDKDVFILQAALVKEGLLSSDLQTGNFLSLTYAAVKNYQRKYGISPVSGFVGPLTRAKLRES